MNFQKDDSFLLPSKRCPECRTTFLIKDQKSGEIVCANCGFVISTNLTDWGPEWRAFTAEERVTKTRVGAPNTFTAHDKGLSTKIDWRDLHGFPPEKKAQLNRLVRWQQRSRISGSTERSLTHALSEMSRITGTLNLPMNVCETASVIYRKAIKNHLTRGRAIQGMAVASIYLACRQCGLVRPLLELSQASGVNKKEVAAFYRLLVEELDYDVPNVKPRQHITRLCNKLGLHGKVEDVAHRLLIAAGKIRLTSGRGPSGVAAAASYIASTVVGDRRTQREIAEVMDVTEVTIRNRYKEMMEKLLIINSL